MTPVLDISPNDARSEFPKAVAAVQRCQAAFTTHMTRLREARTTGSPDLPWLVSERDRLERDLKEATARREQLERITSADDLAGIAHTFEQEETRFRNVLVTKVRALPSELDLGEAHQALASLRELEAQHVGPRVRANDLAAKARTNPNESFVNVSQISVDSTLTELLTLLRRAAGALQAVATFAQSVGLR